VTLPLEGVVVVALEQAVAAPFATRHLADLGARVLKIERVDGGDFARHYDDALGAGLSSWFVWLNRSKESVALDVKSPTGRHRLLQLLRHADVFVQNLAPGAADRLGCSPAELHEANPRLVTCSISGYGPDGPYRDRKAYDLLIQSEAGLVSLTGSPDAPAKAGLSVADIAGGMYAYSGVLAALLQRQSTGRGTHVEVSLFDGLLEWLSHQMTITQMLGQVPRRAGAGHATIAPYRPYPCLDGREVVVAVQNTREWRRLCSAIGRPEVADDARFATNSGRVAASAELDAVLGDRIAQLTSDDLIARLEQAELAWARINDMPAVLAHEQLEARGRWTEVATPGGSYRALRSPIEIDGVEPVAGPVPALGEHTEEVLAWLDELERAAS
jgi:crotonobetainyl-CoA:carnitine CoA-transferase CaiB-like acyl-CoA transferase